MSQIKIIDNPKLKSFMRNIGEWSFTTLMWGLWIYLFLPLLNVVLWLLGFHLFYVKVIERGGYIQLLTLLGKMGWAVLLVFGTLRLWGYYNYIRFGKKNRRKSVSPTTADQLSGFFHLPRDQVLEMQSKKEVVWPVEVDRNRGIIVSSKDAKE
jgi:biofilm PGA synthesis protein PgaD